MNKYEKALRKIKQISQDDFVDIGGHYALPEWFTKNIKILEELVENNNSESADWKEVTYDSGISYVKPHCPKCGKRIYFYNHGDNLCECGKRVYID